MEDYNTVFHYDIIALFETFLNNTVKDEDIFIEGFSKTIFRSDHPGGDQVGGVCIYFKKNLPIKRRKDLEIMQRSVVTEINLNRQKIFFVVIYRSPNQNSENFNLFQENLQKVIDSMKNLKPYTIVITGDFNCRSSQWWSGDRNLPEGIVLNQLLIILLNLFISLKILSQGVFPVLTLLLLINPIYLLIMAFIPLLMVVAIIR